MGLLTHIYPQTYLALQLYAYQLNMHSYNEILTVIYIGKYKNQYTSPYNYKHNYTLSIAQW